MNENPYASPEPVADDEPVDELEEMRRLTAVRSGLGWVLASGVLGVFAMMNLPPVLMHARHTGNSDEWGFAAVLLTAWLVPLTWGMGLCLRCPRRIVPEAVWLIVMSLVLTFVFCAGMVTSLGMRVWSGEAVSYVGMAISGWLWQGFLWRLARGLKNPECAKMAVAVIVTWSLMWVGMAVGILWIHLLGMIGYVLAYLALMWNLRASALYFGELER